MAEMYLGYPLFNGSNTQHQLKLIRDVLGDFPEHYPSTKRTDWTKHRGASISKWKRVLSIKVNKQRLHYPQNSEYIDCRFIRDVLQYDPDKRLSLYGVFSSPYFKTLVFPRKRDRAAMEQNRFRQIQWTVYEQQIIAKIKFNQNEKALSSDWKWLIHHCSEIYHII